MSNQGVLIDDLIRAMDGELNSQQFHDYCPNGLQVQGKTTVSKVVSAVTASQNAINLAIEEKADVLLVHHGYFWKGEPEPLVGMKYRRIQSLMRHDINLVAYHLPLDAHPSLGNNAQLGRRLGFSNVSYLSETDKTLGFVTQLPQSVTANDLSQRLQAIVARPVTHVDVVKPIAKVAWCTGAGQRFIDLAADKGCDAFISGEISEPTTHSARERGIHYFAAGHHATERYGVQALGEWLHENFGVDHCFVDDDNPA